MDHVINGIKAHLDVELDWLREDWNNGNGEYAKLSDCPSYAPCKAMVDAIHVLERYYYGENYDQYKTMSVREQVGF